MGGGPVVLSPVGNSFNYVEDTSVAVTEDITREGFKLNQ